MPGRYLTLEDIARNLMLSLEKDPWDVRHERLDRLSRCSHSLVAKICELGSPDVYLYGQASGKQAPAVIALPDCLRSRRPTLDDMGFLKRARK